MKRLNRKGFTLIELLAVIVILAIVVGITMVTVLPSISTSRDNAFQVSTQTAADFLEKQYQLSLIGQTSVISAVNNGTITSETTIATDDWAKAGLKATNYSSGKWSINSTTGRACVKLTASTTGDYKVDTTKQSSAC